jgi:hypothetical protein
VPPSQCAINRLHVVQELKARLELVERQQREGVEATRAENLRKKEARIARLAEKASNLGRIRQLAGQEMHQCWPAATPQL